MPFEYESGAIDIILDTRAGRTVVVQVYPDGFGQNFARQLGGSGAERQHIGQGFVQALSQNVTRSGPLALGEARVIEFEGRRLIVANTFGYNNSSEAAGAVEAAARNASRVAKEAGITDLTMSVMRGHFDLDDAAAARAMAKGVADAGTDVNHRVVLFNRDSAAQHETFKAGAREVEAAKPIAAQKPMGKDDLTAEVRAAIASEAQRQLDQAPDSASRKFKATLPDGRVVDVTGISAADPVVTDGERFAMINRKEGGPALHAGGMKDTSANGIVETPPQTALRELREEMGFKPKLDQVKVEVMGSPKVNPQDIRFYDPKYDPTGSLAKNYGLKPGDAFIMDSVGVKITLPEGALAPGNIEIVPKGQELTPAQRAAQDAGRLMQAGDDAKGIKMVSAADAAQLRAEGKIGLATHYDMMHEALPNKVPSATTGAVRMTVAEYAAATAGQHTITASAGARNAFIAQGDIPYMRTGIGGNYEALHTGIQAGTPIVIDAGATKAGASTNVRELVTAGDIYPYRNAAETPAQARERFLTATTVATNRPPVNDAIAGFVRSGQDMGALAQQMRMFTIPLGNNSEVSIFDPRLADKSSSLYQDAQKVLASKNIDIDKIKGLGDPKEGAKIAEGVLRSMDTHAEGVRNDKGIKFTIPNRPVEIVDSAGTVWHAGPDTAVADQGNGRISTLAKSKLVDPALGEVPASGSDYVIKEGSKAKLANIGPSVGTEVQRLANAEKGAPGSIKSVNVDNGQPAPKVAPKTGTATKVGIGSGAAMMAVGPVAEVTISALNHEGAEKIAAAGAKAVAEVAVPGITTGFSNITDTKHQNSVDRWLNTGATAAGATFTASGSASFIPGPHQVVSVPVAAVSGISAVVIGLAKDAAYVTGLGTQPGLVGGLLDIGSRIASSKTVTELSDQAKAAAVATAKTVSDTVTEVSEAAGIRAPSGAKQKSQEEGQGPKR